MKTLLIISLICLGLAQSVRAAEKPNFVVIFTDDQGYGDLSCFGGKHVSTPRIDQMAAGGSRLTSFYVAAPVCTPSRAALMTGCYPKRIDMATGSNPVVSCPRTGFWVTSGIICLIAWPEWCSRSPCPVSAAPVGVR